MQLEISFGYNLFFFYFPMKVARGHIYSSRGKPRSPALNDSPVYGCLYNLYVILLVCRKCTVPLKSKLTATHVSILEMQDSILDSRNFRGSSLASRGSSLEF